MAERTRTEKEIRDFIREKREDLNMSQKDLAKKIHLASSNSISEIENGKKKLDHQTLTDIANAFEINVLEIYDKNYDGTKEMDVVTYKSSNKHIILSILAIYFILFVFEFICSFINNETLKTANATISLIALIIIIILFIVQRFIINTNKTVSVYKGEKVLFRMNNKHILLHYFLSEGLCLVSLIIGFGLFCNILSDYWVLLFILITIVLEIVKSVFALKTLKPVSKDSGFDFIMVGISELIFLGFIMMISFFGLQIQETGILKSLTQFFLGVGYLWVIINFADNYLCIKYKKEFSCQ